MGFAQVPGLGCGGWAPREEQTANLVNLLGYRAGVTLKQGRGPDIESEPRLRLEPRVSCLPVGTRWRQETVCALVPTPQQPLCPLEQTL